MQTIVLREPGRFELTDTEDPGAPGRGEVRVRPHRIGICGTDIHAWHGRQPFFAYPRILGHELGVEVMACGDDVSSCEPGDRACILPYLSCGECIACRAGKTNCCTSLQVLGVHVDGGMREEFNVPAETVFVANDLSLDALALVETLGIGCHAVERARLQPGERIVVHGAGPIGLTVIQFAKLAGARIAVVDVDAGRLRFCAEQFQVDYCIDAREEDPTVALREWTRGELPTCVFDATGNRDSMQACIQRVAAGGRIVFVGLVQGSISIDDPEFHRREVSLLASRNATPENFERIIAAIREGTIDVAAWITQRSGVHSFIDNFTGWMQGDQTVIKAMLEVD